MPPSPPPSSSNPKTIIIIGGGIIGSTTAYYLTRHPLYNPQIHNITLLEANAIASGASGKAGGLLAKWAYPAELVGLSWRLHGELAKEHGGEERWGFRRLGVGEVELVGRKGGRTELRKVNQKRGAESTTAGGAKKAKTTQPDTDAILPHTLDFFHPSCVRSYTSMGSPSDTAQVHPHQFTTAMASLATSKGVKLIIGKCTQILQAGDHVTGERYVDKDSQEERTLPATDVVIAAGPWSGTSGVWPAAAGKIGGVRAHSVVVQPNREVGAWAVFTRIQLPAEEEEAEEEKGENLRSGGIDGQSHGQSKKTRQSQGRRKKSKSPTLTPEIYTRPDKTVYICGEGDSLAPLPAGTADVAVDSSRCDEILQAMGSVSDIIGEGEVVVRQACYLPVVLGESKEGPLIGRTRVKGVCMASGHSCWGIMNGPATGLLMSEFVFDGRATSADVGGLDPRGVLE